VDLLAALTGGQLVILIALLLAFSFLVQLAVAKWLYERRQARRRAEAAEQKRSPPGTP
jgi:hypothetical protein